MDFWQDRYFQAMQRVGTARDPRTRKAYAHLARHYRAMCRFSERWPDDSRRRGAA